MKNLMPFLTLVIGLISFGVATAAAQDPVEVSPDHYKVLWENSEVRVLEMTLKSGAKDEMHSHPSEIVRFVTAGKVKLTMPDGGSAEKEIMVGEVMPHDAWTHQVENIGETEIRAIIVEVKATAAE